MRRYYVESGNMKTEVDAADAFEAAKLAVMNERKRGLVLGLCISSNPHKHTSEYDVEGFLKVAEKFLEDVGDDVSELVEHPGRPSQIPTGLIVTEKILSALGMLDCFELNGEKWQYRGN